jgi:citrate lyase subunit beta / citryl-CoA lyase
MESQLPPALDEPSRRRDDIGAIGRGHKRREDRLRWEWPGIELFFPPVRYLGAHQRPETAEEAEQRFVRKAAPSRAHTVIFDLEDGCPCKEESRTLLRRLLPTVKMERARVAVRVNQFRTAEYDKDLVLLDDVIEHIDVVLLSKAGEQYGAAEVRDLCAWAVRHDHYIGIEPIIEHPRALKICDDILAYSRVRHVVFGIHDFSKALGVRITKEHWLDELRVWRDQLLLEARLRGKGVVGGTDVSLPAEPVPDSVRDRSELEQWLQTRGDENARLVYEHARHEAQFGLTGKQVIHPYQVPICAAAFTPTQSELESESALLEAALAANVLGGGAFRFRDMMVDPPMFGRALQTLLRALSLGALQEPYLGLARTVWSRLPETARRDNWPYAAVL